MELVVVFAGESCVGEGVEHAEERRRSGSSGGYEEKVSSIARLAKERIEAIGIWTPRVFVLVPVVGVRGVEGFPI